MFSNTSKYSFIVFSILSLIKGGAAGYVCNEGEIAVGSRTTYYFTGAPAPGVAYYSGFEMTNRCQIIASNGETQDRNQMCKHDYDGGADINCSDPSNVYSARDTTGNNYNCHNYGYDTSCDLTNGLESFYVTACCTRN